MADTDTKAAADSTATASKSATKAKAVKSATKKSSAKKAAKGTAATSTDAKAQAKADKEVSGAHIKHGAPFNSYPKEVQQKLHAMRGTAATSAQVDQSRHSPEARLFAASLYAIRDAQNGAITITNKKEASGPNEPIAFQPRTPVSQIGPPVRGMRIELEGEPPFVLNKDYGGWGDLAHPDSGAPIIPTQVDDEQHAKFRTTQGLDAPITPAEANTLGIKVAGAPPEAGFGATGAAHTPETERHIQEGMLGKQKLDELNYSKPGGVSPATGTTPTAASPVVAG